VPNLLDWAYRVRQIVALAPLVTGIAARVKAVIPLRRGRGIERGTAHAAH
jgi:hypothetical protein